jgi:hypothetical protein
MIFVILRVTCASTAERRFNTPPLAAFAALAAPGLWGYHLAPTFISVDKIQLV